MIRFLIALLLAVAAAGLNYVWISGKRPQTTPFLMMATDLKRGELIEDQNLTTVPLPRGNDVLLKTFISNEHLAAIRGTKAKRDFKKGEMLQHVDIAEAADVPPEYGVLGPFEILEAAPARASDTSIVVRASYRAESARPNEYTFDEKTRRLIEILEQQRLQPAGPMSHSDLRIVAIVSCPPDLTADSGPLRGIEQADYGILVQLPPGTSIPASVLKDRKIAFLIPASALPKTGLHR